MTLTSIMSQVKAKKEWSAMFESVNIHVSSVAVFMQIENLIQFALASGTLKPGDKLPAVRELAEKLGHNMNTVGKAYRDLEVMGIVYTRRGMGVFINKGIGANNSVQCHRKIAERLYEVTCEAKAAGMTLPQVKELCSASFASGGAPYSETPANVLALAKKSH